MYACNQQEIDLIRVTPAPDQPVNELKSTSLPDSLLHQLASSTEMDDYFHALNDFYEPFVDEYNSITDTTVKKRFVIQADSLYSIYDSTGNSTDKNVYTLFMGYASISSFEALAGSIASTRASLNLHTALSGLTDQEINEAVGQAMGIAIDEIEIGVPIIREFEPPVTPPLSDYCEKQRTKCYRISHDFAYKDLDTGVSLEAIYEAFLYMIKICDANYEDCKR